MKKKLMIMMTAVLMVCTAVPGFAHGHGEGHHSESHESSSYCETYESVCESTEHHYEDDCTGSVCASSGCSYHENCSGEYCGPFGRKKCHTRRTHSSHHHGHH